MRNNEVYRSNDENYFLQGQHRILWLNEDLDLAMTIPIPELKSGSPAYFGSPKKRSYVAIQQAIQSGVLLKVNPETPPLACMSDEQIRKRYPGPKEEESKPLAIRDSYQTALSAILETVKNDPRSLFEDNTLSGLVKKTASNSKYGINQIYSALNKYLAFGIGINGLLPLLNRCGAPKKERKQSTRLGRKTLAHQSGVTSSSGTTLSSEDKDNLAWGWRVFLDGKNSVDDAYLLTLAMYWSDGTHVVDGEELPKLLPARQRPTLAQFRRWGPKGEENQDAWITLLSKQDWEKSYRARKGTALDGIRAVGQVAVGDGTSNDISLVSMTSRLKPIGYSNRIILHDAFSDIIPGFYVGLDAPSEQVALQAVLSAATSMYDLCKQHGIQLREDQIPDIFFTKYLVDNGEYRTAHSMKVLTALGSSLEYAAVGRADLKGRSEAGHRSVHKLTSHKITGTSGGKQKQRGEDKPAYLACWRHHEYVRLLLKAIIYFNCEQRVPKFMNIHPYRTAMKRDGVPPIRRAIFQWGVKKGLVASPPFNEDHLRASLLTKMKASVQSTGIYLIRQDRGRRNDIVQSHRFIGPRATELQWLERARRSGAFRIEVRANPNDLKKIWYVDDEGLHELINRSNDRLLVESGTLSDSLIIQDQDTIDEHLACSESDQARSDLVTARAAADDSNRRAKEEEKKASDTKPTKYDLSSQIRENRADEIAAMAGEILPQPENVFPTVDLGEELDTDEDAEAADSDYLAEILGQHRHEENCNESV